MLAAGASARLGKPKQLLAYQGKNLINHVIDTINDATLNPVILVLGANASLIAPGINDKNILITINSSWQEGIASSIRTGIAILQQKFPLCDGALIMVCDQPFITSSVLLELLQTQKQSGKPIAACVYDNITGTPALFHKSFFPELLLLKGDKGAGKILNERPGEVATVDFPMGRFDIDTEDDYAAFRKQNSG